MSPKLPQLGGFASARELSGPQRVAEAPAAAPACSAWRRVSPSPIVFLLRLEIAIARRRGTHTRDCRDPDRSSPKTYTYNQGGADTTTRPRAAQGGRGVP